MAQQLVLKAISALHREGKKGGIFLYTYFWAGVAGLALLCAVSGGCDMSPKPKNKEEARYFAELWKHRAERDTQFAMAANSPLPAAEKGSFRGLKYFPINPEFRFTSKLQKFAKPDTISMMTTNGKDRPALRYGRFAFDFHGVRASLIVYKFLDQLNPVENHLFLPFLDQTSGKESYGGGRYLDLFENGEGVYIVDFNYAYNPSCAYGREYICPVPPAENKLNVAVRAGEKAWH